MPSPMREGAGGGRSQGQEIRPFASIPTSRSQPRIVSPPTSPRSCPEARRPQSAPSRNIALDPSRLSPPLPLLPQPLLLSIFIPTLQPDPVSVRHRLLFLRHILSRVQPDSGSGFSPWSDPGNIETADGYERRNTPLFVKGNVETLRMGCSPTAERNLSGAPNRKLAAQQQSLRC